jgi:alanine racemase
MANLRLALSGSALVGNWRWLEARAGVPAAVAVKADGYGLGAGAVVARLHAAGARTFAVSTFAEAAALGSPGEGAAVLVLHGFFAEDAALAAAMPWVRPVLNTPGQVAAWAGAFPGRLADLMADTGMNRLGLAPEDVPAALAAVPVDTLHSHLAAADEPGHPMNARQRDRFSDLAAATPRVRHMLANSAGVCLGPGYGFDGARVGIGVYGGAPTPGVRMAPVVAVEARVLQVRAVPEGAAVGYGATWVAARPSRIATVNLGYADGLPRALAPHLGFMTGGVYCPVVGRISMDLITVDVTGADVREGEWLALALDLPDLSAASGVAQYELLVALSRRYERRWT